MENEWDEDVKAKEKCLWCQLEVREIHEAIFWKQKARIKWLGEGERNTNFFHITWLFKTGAVRESRSFERLMEVGWRPDER